MTSPTIKTDNPKGKALSLLENVLFICCVIVIVLRATYAEAPMPQSAQIQAAINDTVYSLALSAVLIFASLLLLLVALFSGRLSYRTTAMGIGLAILFAGATLSAFCAANKRAAITASITLLAPLLMAISLIGLLDSHAKIKILLIVIVALGLVASWQSADQLFVSNNVMLQQYQDDPNSILQPLGVQPGTLNHMLLEHRIYSKDVRASFTTSNSAGSFAILTSFAAIALLAELLKDRKTSSPPSGNPLLAGCVLIVVLFGLALTHSKGAIAAFLFAAVIFALLVRTKRPKLSKNVILAGAAVGLVALVPVVAWFGLRFGQLPGGNSMLVRWQYWHASAQMVADHPLTGVGGGNFATLYHRYKHACAPETITDPHSLFLSPLTQYGPLGLLGFLIIVLAPLWRTSLSSSNTLERPAGTRFKKLAIACIIAPVLVMLLLRPFIIPPSTASTLDEKLYILFTDYIAPAVTFAVGVILLMKALETVGNNGYSLQNTSVTAIALFAGLLGVLIHNLIDFAIFEPGVLTTFCAVLACLVALDLQTLRQPKAVRATPGWLKAAAIGAFLIIGYGYFNYALLPVAKSTAKIAKARRSIELGWVYLAHNLLTDATEDDALSPDAPAMNGRLYLQRFYRPSVQQPQMLTRLDWLNEAEQALFIAAQRNPEDYKNFESLADVYSLRAKLHPDQKNHWLNEAFAAASVALSLYPGDAELHFRLAQLAEETGQPDTALKHYRETVQIEDSFRKQFRLMYPDRQVISRMPSDKYLLAKKRLEALSK